MILHSLLNKLGYFKHDIRKRYLKEIAVFVRKNKIIFLTILIFGIVDDILFLRESSDFIIFSILFFYGILVKIAQVKSKSTFLLCLVLLGIMFIDFIITGTSVSTEKAAVWFILFLGFGIIHQWRELRD